MDAQFVFFLLAMGGVYTLWKYNEPLGNLLMHASRACECGRSWRRCSKQWTLK